jgi:hypothetical protein
LGERGNFAVSSGLALTAKNEQRKIRQMGVYFIERTFKKYVIAAWVIRKASMITLKPSARR